MNKKLLPYYISRSIISAAFGVVFYATGSPLWSALLMGAVMLAFFIWAPHSGRYSVHPEFGVTALRRDEFTQVINDKAARNAFVASMLAIAAIAIYAGSMGAVRISTGLLKMVLVLGATTYFASDLWLRRLRQ